LRLPSARGPSGSIPGAAALAFSRTPLARGSVPVAPPALSVAAGAVFVASKSFWTVPLSVISTDARGEGVALAALEALAELAADESEGEGAPDAAGAALALAGDWGASAGPPPHATAVTAPIPKRPESTRRLAVVLFMGG
jgi:hypothetical protein